MRAVTFDLWRTLLYEQEPFYFDKMKRVRLTDADKVLRRFGYRFDYHELSHAYEVQGEKLQEVWLRDVDVPASKQVSYFTESLGILDLDEGLRKGLEEAFGLALAKHLPKVSDGIVDILESLKEKGIRIGLVSNVGRTWGMGMRVVLEMVGLKDYFDAFTFSDEVGFRKPRREIFEAALKELKVKPSETVHVGDLVREDIEGAKALGMRAVLYRDGRELPPNDGGADAIIDHFSQLPTVLEGLER